MRKGFNIICMVIVLLLSQLAFSQEAFSATDTHSQSHKCVHYAAYGLTPSDISSENSNLYCWEIRYLRDYKNTLSMNVGAYKSLYPKHLSPENIDVLRKLGVTPEKADYLYKYFVPTNPNPSIKYEKLIKGAIAKARDNVVSKSHYKYGRPVWFLPSLSDRLDPVQNTPTLVAANLLLSQAKGYSFYSPVLKIFGIDCLTTFSSVDSAFDVYPYALKPVGVIGSYIVNPFVEIVGKIDTTTNYSILSPPQVYTLGSNKAFAKWEYRSCSIHDVSDEIRGAFSCISCTIFEIAFNTVSRIGFVLFDKLSRYAIEFMIVLFAFWSIFMFYNNAIKNQDGYGYMKTFFTKYVWLVIVGALLTVSITDENNIVNYSIRPITDFMVSYNKMMTKMIDKSDKPFACTYATKDIADSKVLFSSDVKKDIVCTIERLSNFNTLNITIGKYQVIQGFHQMLNFQFASGIIKIILGIIIVGLFFFYNLTIPFFFIESLFKIASVVFLFPLGMVGYAFERKQFVSNGLNTFLSAVFQIISMSIMCCVVSLLLTYISNIDFASLQSALENNNSQEMTSQMFLMLSFNTNKLLEIIYTGILCWYLMGQALTIANKFGSSETLPNRFKDWSENIVSVFSSTVRENSIVKKETSELANKLNSFKEKYLKRKQGEIDEMKKKLTPKNSNK